MSRKKVLVYLTDDDADDRELFAEALSDIPTPTTIVLFSNGVDLMAKLLKQNQNLPDILFIDLNMPMMTGEECITDIRAEPAFDNIPIVVYSTTSDSEQLLRLEKLGANRYLQKPNTFFSLKAKLQVALSPDNLTTSLRATESFTL